MSVTCTDSINAIELHELRAIADAANAVRIAEAMLRRGDGYPVVHVQNAEAALNFLLLARYGPVPAATAEVR